MYPATYTNISTRVSLTRPANTTAYVSGQIIASSSTSILIIPAGVGGRGGYINKVLLTTNKSAHTETIRLHLFSNNTNSVADQTALNFSALSEVNYEGFVDFTSFFSTGSNYAVALDSLVNPLQFSTGTNNEMYGFLEARAGFTPIASQTFAIKVYMEYSS